MPKPHLPRLLTLALAAAAGLQTTAHAADATTPFSQIIVFGDSLSDTGNDAHRANDNYGIRFPGPSVFDSTGDASTDYTDGRFTDGMDTDPSAVLYKGVWHEQLATLFLGMKAVDPSLDGGTDYAFGGATTGDGQSVLSEEDGAVSLHVDNVQRQVATYFDSNTPDPAALYIVWAGANDLFDDMGEDQASYDATANAASNNEVASIQRLAEGGAKYFLVNNLPPLELTPDYNNPTNSDTPIIKEATVNFNTQLAQKLAGVQTALANEGITVTIYQMDVYGLFQRLLANQYAYGFTDIVDPSQTADSSTDPDKSLFWDGVHPTTAGHFQLAAEAYTVLTGVPIVETNPAADKSGFYLTRTGTDISAPLKVSYVLNGGVSSGDPVTAVAATKKIKAGKQFAEVPVTAPTANETTESLKLKASATGLYELPVVRKAKIKLND